MTWSQLKKQTNDQITLATNKFLDGDIDKDRWESRMREILRDAHDEAGKIGKALSDNPGDLSENDLIEIQRSFDRQMEFFAAFVDELESSKYLKPDGNYKKGAILLRAGLYTNTVRATADFIWINNITDKVNWILTSFEPCNDCPWLAEGGPYDPKDLYTVPAAGDTECGAKCKCRLETVNGTKATEF